MKASKRGALAPDALRRPAGGLEAEFTLFVDDEPVRPEDLFDDPRDFIGDHLLHRVGTSYHLPNGAAVYFDTGVIELATPAMELERGCFGRLARSLDEAILYVRAQLDAWEARTGHRARLQGFSTHYNLSVGNGVTRMPSFSRLNALAWLIVHVIAAPVMLLATNRRSTGVGARPRTRRIEVTADFSPDAERIAATGTFVAGVALDMLAWPDLTQGALGREGIPFVRGFRPARHSSRRGWVARFDGFPFNPFTCDVDAPIWPCTDERLPLRTIAMRVRDRFAPSIARLADPIASRVIGDVLSGRRSSWLQEEGRPAAYDDVGRADWPGAGRLKRLRRSRYERVLVDAVAGRPVYFQDRWWTPVAVRGWSRVTLRANAGGALATVPIDTLAELPDA